MVNSEIIKVEKFSIEVFKTYYQISFILPDKNMDYKTNLKDWGRLEKYISKQDDFINIFKNEIIKANLLEVNRQYKEEIFFSQ